MTRLTKGEVATLRDGLDFCKPRAVPTDYMRYFCGLTYWEQQYCVWKLAKVGKEEELRGWKSVREIWDCFLALDYTYATRSQRTVIFRYAKKLARRLLKEKKS